MNITGFYIDQGIEARHFILSGLVDKAMHMGKVVLFIAKKINSPYLNDYLKNLDVEIIIVNDISPNKYSVLISKIIRALRNSRKRLKNIGLYSHISGTSDKLRKYDFITGNDFINYFIDFFARPIITYLNCNLMVEKIIIDSKIDNFYILEYGGTMNNTLSSVCSKYNISVHVVLNSLKTVFINDFIPFKIDSLFCWNLSQATLFRSANITVKESAFKVTGLPFHSFLRNENLENSQRVLEKYNLDKYRPIIVYPLIYEKVFPNEHLIIEKINAFFNSFSKDTRPQLILRQNPFQENDFLLKYVQNFSNVTIADNYWERNSTLNWSIQSIKGELEWKALLQIANLMVSYPSMSVVESIVVGTPVLNIGFDQMGFENTALKHIIHAPFVKEFEKSDYVSKCLNFDDFKDNFLLFLKLKNKSSNSKIASSIDIKKSDLSCFF